MLPRFYRFTVLNATGQTIAPNAAIVHMRRWKRGSDGSITYEATEATVLDNPTTFAAAMIGGPDKLPDGPVINPVIDPRLVTGGYFDGTIQDNSTDKWEGGTVEFTVTAPASASGPVLLFVKRSTDGTDFDDDALALELERLVFTTAGVKRLTFQL